MVYFHIDHGENELMATEITRQVEPTFMNAYWRHLLLALIVIGSLTAMLVQAPFGQDQKYHDFADSRLFFNIPNFGDVASNLVFLFAGLAGLKICFEKGLGRMANAWFVMFAGITLVGIASAYYHWNPTDQTLVWDRMSLTIGFMGLFVAILGEYVSEKFRYLLIPAVLAGVGSVLYWNWFDDLRFYYWIQMVPLLALPLIMMLYGARFSHQGLLLGGAIWYGLAKLAELGDKIIFANMGGLISGHTLKHIFAGVGCMSIAIMLRKREEIIRSQKNVA